MFLSKLFIPITKDLPAEAKIKSHQLMLRTGMIKQSSAGIYSWLPLGFKVMKKIEQIVREEQNFIGAQEMLMPTIQSSEIWKESGRYEDYGEEMLRIKDRQGREMLYGPTNEELVTDVFRSSVKSYKSLPQLLYHIQWKFRDEIRPRFGVMRCKEFYMKDAYSFDLSDEDAKKSYNKMFYSYLKTFNRLGLKAIPMAADTGPIGGDLSHEFVILAETGESQIFADKNIFEINLNQYEFNDSSLKKMREDFSQIYAVTDEKFKKEDFNEKVKRENQVITKGIEVGHIFYFSDKYSKPMNCLIDDKNGKKTSVKMGSYGIGVSRLVGATIEANYNNDVMKWPKSISPYDVVIIPSINKNNKENLEKAEKIYVELKKQNIDVLLDDVDENMSNKFKKHDLIGVPYQIIIGSKSEGDNLEFKELNFKSEITSLEKIKSKLKLNLFTKAERLISLRNLRPKKKEGFLKIISIFSFLGITLGVAILIIVMSVMNGFKTELTNKILGLNPHIVIQPNDFKIESDFILKLKNDLKDISYSKSYSGEGIIISNNNAKGVILKGVNKNEKNTIEFFNNFISNGHIKNFNSNSIIIGSELSFNLNLSEGDTLSLMSSAFVSTPFGSLPKQQNFKVAGVFRTGFLEFDQNIILMNIDDALSIFDKGYEDQNIEIYLDDPLDADLYKRKFKK